MTDKTLSNIERKLKDLQDVLRQVAETDTDEWERSRLDAAREGVGSAVNYVSVIEARRRDLSAGSSH
jgi:hypothetical protein